MKFSKVCPIVLLAIVCAIASPAWNAFAADGDDLLTIGTKAPSLDIEHWVSNGNGHFDKITEFKDGQVYVIEFWATWCGPCIASMPHLAETQKEYADKGVQLISVSDEDLETVNGFLEGVVQGEDELTYAKLTSAYCLTTDPDRSVYQDYMEAAAQNGIPTAFIVGKGGFIEWIGHPMEMDEPLEQVVAGKWDRAAAKTKFVAAQKRDKLMMDVVTAMRSGDTDEALKIIDAGLKENAGDAETVASLTSMKIRVQATPAMLKIRAGETKEGLEMLAKLKDGLTGDERDAISTIQLQAMLTVEEFDGAAEILNELTASAKPNPMMLNQVVWTIYEQASAGKDFDQDVVKAAASAAAKAAELEPENGAILDTYAHYLHLAGKLDQAIEVQTRALEHAAGQEAEIAPFLEQLKKEKSGGK